jgi:hypothetical protein
MPSGRPNTANVLNMGSPKTESRPQTAAAGSSRHTFKATMHSPPRFTMDGSQLTFGKHAGLAATQGPILSLTGKVFVPKNWTGKPKHKTKVDLFERRRKNDKVQQKELQKTLDRKLNIVKRPSLAKTYSRVLAGCVPIPCLTRTQSDLFNNRIVDQLSSITEKSKRREDMRQKHPSKTRNRLAIAEQERDWEKNQKVKSRYEQLIAPMGRERELGRKTHWTKDHHPFIGPGYRENPKYPTRQAILKSRQKEINMLATQKINESWNQTQKRAIENENKVRQTTLKTHVPLHATQSELFETRRMQPVKEAIMLSEKSRKEHEETRSRCMTAPAIPRGWWQKGDKLLDSSSVLNKGSVVRLKTIAQRQVQPQVDPFKQYNISMHNMNRTRSQRQRQSVELAVVDRTGPEWNQGETHLPKQPSIPVKRWSDVVIEFKQADQKLDDARMDNAPGGGAGGGGGSVMSLSDTRPLYSSFTKDQIFREPQYKDSIKDKLNALEQASFVMKPLGRYNLEGSGSRRSLTLMQRSQRATRFRQAYGEKVRLRGMAMMNSGAGDGSAGMGGSLHASSSFGGVPTTPGQDDRERFRDNGSSRGNPSRQTTGLGGTMKMDPPAGRRAPSPIIGRGGTPIGGSMMSGGMGGVGGSTSQLEMNNNAGGSTMMDRHTQSVPDLSEIRDKSRASTAPSSAQRNASGLEGNSNKSRRGTPTRRLIQSRGSSRSGIPSRNNESFSGLRPTTAPLRLQNRPGTAVRTRGFWDD